MPTHRPARTSRRLALVGAAALTATLSLAGPAFAHTEVEADKAQALAENVTLTFVSEAESDDAGFREVRVVLPEGIAPADVTLDEAPKGWKFTVTDDGYSVGGTALKPGVDAEYKIKVRQLPDAEQLVFKTIDTYSDGEISRWIELPGGGAEPEQPAPVLKLKAAAAGATPIGQSPTATTGPTASATETPAAVTPATASATTAAASDGDEGGSTGLIAGGTVAAVVVLGGGAWWLARRRRASAGD
ncbi:DUF1775 domain-containing protein [Streptomyces sp. H51]|uniref:DUF1775 domain-containing protein n=1 Tax=Streptomyces sp. H51 TaxID=3111770 RepID=UPI002D77EE3C|nr:DUF1775 domain-containing protein [Streptomyces sp. H51]